jgi:hypothetical protein
MAPRDPILGLTESYNADQRLEKVNLGVGVYYKHVAAKRRLLLKMDRMAGFQEGEQESIPLNKRSDGLEAVSPASRVAGIQKLDARPNPGCCEPGKPSLGVGTSLALPSSDPIHPQPNDRPCVSIVSRLHSSPSPFPPA